MRNLKKILAMVLALIMSLSLMATAGATDFKDDEKVASSTYRQAIEVLSGLGVFNGDQNNNFNPDDEITRAEVAAIIYRITTGDVENVRADSYSLYNQFTDVEVGSWYEGYVSYCHNAGYVKGHGDGTFKPNDKISGYQALAMILRAVGYDTPGHELFIGDSWEVNTASIATQRGVLKNINNTTSAVSLRENANRALVAEILFQSFLLNKVEWNIVSGTYTPVEEKVCDVLNVEDIEGVVMANKWADLENDTVLKDGLTRLDVDGKDYVLEIDTPITAIGEMRHAYVQNGTKVIGNLTEGDLEDLGTSAVAEPENKGGKGAKVATIAKEGNIKLTNDTEYFVNFGEGEYYTSEWQIRYTVEFGNAVAKNLFAERYANVDDAVKYDEERDIDDDDMLQYVDGNELKLQKTIRAGMEITGYDLLIMQGIFGSAADKNNTNTDNSVQGAVYVGTVKDANTGIGNNAVTSGQIVSNDRSWSRFFDEFIDNNATNYTQSDNGEWLKIVDKDGDGNADYVLRTDFIMTTVIDYNKENDAYILEYIDPVSAKHIEMPKDEVNFVPENLESLVEGDLILYTYIDGVYHVDIPEQSGKATLTKTPDFKNNVATFDIVGEGEAVEKTWSGIDNKAAYYRNDITSLEGKGYTLYYDHFGYVRLYKESSKGFVLLNDAYYYTDMKRENTFKAEIFNPETGKLEEVAAYDRVWGGVRDINDGIINTTEDDAIGGGSHVTTGHGNRGTWKRLNTFGFYNYDRIYQNPTDGYRHNAYITGYPRAEYDVYNAIFGTNVVAYDVADDVYNLYDVSAADTFGDKSDVRYNAYTLVTTGKTEATDNANAPAKVTADPATASARTLWGIVNWSWDDNGTPTLTDDTCTGVDRVQRIHTTADTVYYWVNGAGTDKAEVVSWTGYNKAPSGFTWDGTKASSCVAYVITSTVEVDEKNTAYETAEVVVFEGSWEKPDDYKSGAIAAQGNVPSTNKNDKDTIRVADMIVSPTVLYMMGWNGKDYTTDIQNKYVDDRGESRYEDGGMLRFYRLLADGTYDLLDPDEPGVNYYDYHFYAGYVVTERDTDNKLDGRYGYLNKAQAEDIVSVDQQLEITGGKPKALWHGGESHYDPDTVQVYRFTKVTDTYGRVGYDWTPSTINYNDKVLYITDANNEAKMIFNVTESIKAAGKDSEIAAKLDSTVTPPNTAPYAGLWGLWNDVQTEWQTDKVTNANRAVVNVITKDNLIDSLIGNAIATQEFRANDIGAGGIVTVDLPDSTDFTAAGWSWGPLALGDSSPSTDKIIVTDAAGEAVKWVALGANQIQLQGVKLGGSYTVALVVDNSTSAAVTTINLFDNAGGAVDSTVAKVLKTDPADATVGYGQTITIYVAAKDNAEVTAVAAAYAETPVVTEIQKDDAGLEGVSLTGFETGCKYYKITAERNDKSSDNASVITITVNTGYGLVEADDSSGAAEIVDIDEIKFAPGTKLNTISFKVNVTDGNVLRVGTAYASVTSVKMGSTYVPYTAEQKDVNNLNEWTITLTADAAAEIKDNLTVRIVTAAGSTELPGQVANNGEDIELNESKESNGKTTYELEVLPEGGQATVVMNITTPADQTVTAVSDGNKVTVSAGSPYPAGSRSADNMLIDWTITIPADEMRQAATEAEGTTPGTGAAKLAFSIVIVQNAPAGISGTATVALTPAAAGVDAAADAPTCEFTNPTPGAESTEAVYKLDLTNVAFTANKSYQLNFANVATSSVAVDKLVIDDAAGKVAAVTKVVAALNDAEGALYTAAQDKDGSDNLLASITLTKKAVGSVSDAPTCTAGAGTAIAATAEVYKIDLTGLTVTPSTTAASTVTISGFGTEDIVVDLAKNGDRDALITAIVSKLGTTLTSTHTVAAGTVGDANKIIVTNKTPGTASDPLLAEDGAELTITCAEKVETPEP